MGHGRRGGRGWLSLGKAGGSLQRAMDLYGCDEAIALAGNRLHERGGVGGIAQRLADFANRRVHPCLDVDEDVLTPEAIDDLTPQHELASPFDEQQQQVHRLPLDPHGTSVPTQLVGADVQLEVTEPKSVRGIWYQHLGVASESRTRAPTVPQPPRYLPFSGSGIHQTFSNIAPWSNDSPADEDGSHVGAELQIHCSPAST